MIFQEVPLLRGGPDWLDKEAGFNKLPTAKKQDFMALYSQCNCHKSPCEETPVMRIWDVNSFELESIGPGNYAVFKVASRINHACFPNAFRGFTKDGNIVIIASEDIKIGQEITHDYDGAASIPVDFRRKHLQKKYGFYCRCRGCVGNKVSPMDVFIRELDEMKKPVEVITSEILGQHSSEELASMASFETWYQGLNEYLLRLHDIAIAGIRSDLVRGVDSRDLLRDRCRTVIGERIKANNKFGLSDDVIEKYALRKSLRFKQVADIIFGGYHATPQGGAVSVEQGSMPPAVQAANSLGGGPAQMLLQALLTTQR